MEANSWYLVSFVPKLQAWYCMGKAVFLSIKLDAYSHYKYLKNKRHGEF